MGSRHVQKSFNGWKKELTGGLLSLSTLGAQCLGHNSEAALLSYAHSHSKCAPVINAAMSALCDTMIHDISQFRKAIDRGHI